MKKIKNFLLLATYYLLLATFLSGCATVATRQTLPTYNLNGATYLPLISLCSLRGIRWDYDTFTRQVSLNKDAHRINLMVGETLVLVDEKPLHLKHPVDIYQGTVVVPYSFKEKVLDVLFKELRPAVTPLSKIRKIVIDAGHGGTDPGALGRTGIREKIITLDIAKRLNNILKNQGFDVVMTRTTDRYVPLETRVDIANNSKADLFLSIHANANRVRSLRGFEVYYISTSVDDSKRAISAAQNAALDFDRSCFAGNSFNLKVILWDMIYTSNRAESIELARSICRSINRDLDARILGIKGARFYILKGVRMPAVLVEVGFLSNSDEERMLKNSYYRQKVAESITAAVGDYARDTAVFAEAR